MCAGEICRALGVPVSHLGRSVDEVFCVAHEYASCCSKYNLRPLTAL